MTELDLVGLFVGFVGGFIGCLGVIAYAIWKGTKK